MNPEVALNEVRRWAAKHGIIIPACAMDQLCVYMERLILWNPRVSLVARAEPPEIACKHFADSVFATRACKDGDRIVDLGSGAGFPGLVIAILMPTVTVCAVDSRRKKVSFMNEVIATAGITNARAVESRLEILAHDDVHQNAYTVVIARALSGTEKFLQIARAFLANDGRAVAMKGPKHREELATFAPAEGDFYLDESVDYRLPDGSRRTLVVFKLRR